MMKIIYKFDNVWLWSFNLVGHSFIWYANGDQLSAFFVGMSLMAILNVINDYS